MEDCDDGDDNVYDGDDADDAVMRWLCRRLTDIDGDNGDGDSDRAVLVIVT